MCATSDEIVGRMWVGRSPLASPRSLSCRVCWWPPTAIPIAVLSNSQQNSQWVVSLEKSTRNLTLTPLNPVAVSSNNSLELWSIPAGEKPHSLGLLNTSGPTQLILAENQLTDNSLLAISLEPHGGSPTGQPTGAVLFSGPLQNL